jgi:hypothetical protein
VHVDEARKDRGEAEVAARGGGDRPAAGPTETILSPSTRTSPLGIGGRPSIGSTQSRPQPQRSGFRFRGRYWHGKRSKVGVSDVLQASWY